MNKTFEEILEENGTLLYTNVGVSMLPLLHEGRDVMIIRSITRDLKEYDAVLYKRQHIKGRGEYVMHRILKINPDGTYWIVGDNTLSGECVKRENIIGILEGVLRNGKNINFNGKLYKLYLYLWIRPYKFRFFVTKLRSLPFRVLYFVYKHTVRKLRRK